MLLGWRRGGGRTGDLGAGKGPAGDGDDPSRADGGGADVEGGAEGAVEGVEEGELGGGGGCLGEGAGGGEEEGGEGEAHFDGGWWGVKRGTAVWIEAFTCNSRFEKDGWMRAGSGEPGLYPPPSMTSKDQTPPPLGPRPTGQRRDATWSNNRHAVCVVLP